VLALLRLALRLAPRDVLAASLLSLVAGGAFAALIPLVNAALGQPSRRLAALFFAACMVALIARTTSQILLTRLGIRAMNRLRRDLVDRTLAASLENVERVGAARVEATFNEDVPAVAAGLGALPTTLVGFVTVLGLLAYVAILDWRVFALITAVLLVGVATFQLPINASERWYKVARARIGEVHAAMRQLVLGYKELKLSRAVREEFSAERLEPAAAQHYHHSVIAGAFTHFADTWGYVLAFVVIGSIPFGFARLLDLRPTVLSGVTLTVLALLGPLDTVLSHLTPFLRAGVALDRIEELSRRLTPEPAPARDPDPEPTRSMRLEGVRFRYDDPDSSFELGPVSLEFHAGAVTFLVGGNGSGKTTLFKILCLLYPPTEGAVLVNGKAVGPDERPALRDRFGVLFADYYLPTWGRVFTDDAGKARFEALAERFDLTHVLRVRGNDVSSEGLSSGQRKRLALIFLLLRDPPIFLFDEWTSDQDPKYRRVFYEELLPELRARGKVVIVITHDERYFDRADAIVRLDTGQLQPDGVAQRPLAPGGVTA
jgi:putative ATP-binding cassette transporter